MRWRRFLPILIAGLVLSVGIACAQLATRQSATPEPQPSIAVESSPSVAAAAELPAETEAIAASVSGGLFNPPRGDVRFVVFSDLNSSYGSTDYDPDVDKVVTLLPFWQPDMVLCSGDMVAGQDISLSPDQLNAMWSAFDQHVAAPLRQAKLPYGFTLGNHDASSAQGVGGAFLFQQERDVAAQFWLDPAHDPGVEFVDRTDYPFYFTFKFNDIFFISWDGSSNIIPPDKLAWVEQALASPEAQQAKMRILLGHLPLYAITVGRDEPGEVMQNADQLRAMLEKYNVHTHISGHDHGYFPAHRGTLQLLHTGILGSGPRPLLNSDLPPWKAVTVIDVMLDSPNLSTYTTYEMQTLQPIDHAQLPRFITGHNGITIRRDLKWEDLTAAEKAQCEQQIGKERCTA
ncbi:MAG: metallophosphoesterase [Leptolyngbyaceae cyanobacterium SL_7_1]|nr:metallophosphoesterase [Leptolyngbyaceae cyanobacterium SL_7_1]